MSFEHIVEQARAYAERSFERRLILLLGDDINGILGQIDKFLDVNSVVVSDDEKVRSYFRGISIPLKEASRIDKRPLSNALLDLRDHPDLLAMSKVIYNVRGGGLVFLVLPITYLNKDKYMKKLKSLGTQGEPRDIIRRRLLLKAFSYPGIYIYSISAKRFIRIPEEREKSREKRARHKGYLESYFYSQCPTDDSKLALEKAYEFLNDDKDILLVVGNRNRYKSEIVGLALVAYAREFRRKVGRPLRIILTSQDFYEAKPILSMITTGLNLIGERFRSVGYSIDSNILSVKYMDAGSVSGKDADVVVVDEAGGLLFQLSNKIIRENKKIIMIITLHGYAGSSRSLIDRVKELSEEEGMKYEYVEINEPMFYSIGDPIEAWLEDSLFFDAEPLELSDYEINELLDKKEQIEFRRVNHFKHFLGEKEKELKNVMGILSSAHYRTSPERILFLADAPHYLAFIVTFNEKPIAGIEIVKEGGLSDEEISLLMKTSPPGNIIPDKMLKYAGEVDFPHLIGWRIYSVAVHPKIIGKHIGSYLISELIKIAKKSGIDWVGASFPGYLDLTLFWTFNKFIPVHVSPKINKKIGEHTIIGVRPISKAAENCVKNANIELKNRVLKEANTTYRKLNDDSFRILLKRSFKYEDFKLKLTRGQSFRLKLYLSKTLHFESVSDVVNDLVFYYFMRNLGSLSTEEELLLINGVLKRNRMDLRKILKVREIIFRLVVSSINL